MKNGLPYSGNMASKFCQKLLERHVAAWRAQQIGKTFTGSLIEVEVTFYLRRQISWTSQKIKIIFHVFLVASRSSRCFAHEQSPWAYSKRRPRNVFKSQVRNFSKFQGNFWHVFNRTPQKLKKHVHQWNAMKITFESLKKNYTLRK